MIKSIGGITLCEWRYWLRSKIVLASTILFFLLIIVTSVISAHRMNVENHIRIHQQEEAEEIFLSQPDRHPHRMVHYGHYLFRTPAPLAGFDPGIDVVTGQAIFLEGHRQNTVMFPELAASADFGGLSWVSPALIYQLFAPLLIILLGYGSMVRERESGVLISILSMGISKKQLIIGKLLALISFVILMMIPLVLSCLGGLGKGETVHTLLALYLAYFMYLTIWSSITLLSSGLFRQRTMVLGVLASIWFMFTLVIPSIAVNFATVRKPVMGKIESDLIMLEEIRKLGDGHDANDPAFQKLRADILKQYNSDKVEELPINFRGIVAMEGEKKLTEVLNKFAANRMADEAKQESYVSHYAFLTPTIAISMISRSIIGTDLAHYHLFQKEAESVRYEFVQGLNQVHVDKLSYQDDINRNKDEASWQRARGDSSNWQVLNQFKFNLLNLSQRFANTVYLYQILLAWLIVLFGSLIIIGRKETL